MAMSDLDGEIRTALDKVCDPCSIAANVPLSILDMGLVRGWSIDAELNLRVDMCLTSPSCTMSPYMVKAAETLLSSIDGLTSVRVEVDPAVFWTPDDMSEKGRHILEGRRAASLRQVEAVPQHWRSGAR